MRNTNTDNCPHSPGVLERVKQYGSHFTIALFLLLTGPGCKEGFFNKKPITPKNGAQPPKTRTYKQPPSKNPHTGTFSTSGNNNNNTKGKSFQNQEQLGGNPHPVFFLLSEMEYTFSNDNILGLLNTDIITYQTRFSTLKAFQDIPKEKVGDYFNIYEIALYKKIITEYRNFFNFSHKELLNIAKHLEQKYGFFPKHIILPNIQKSISDIIGTNIPVDGLYQALHVHTKTRYDLVYKISMMFNAGESIPIAQLTAHEYLLIQYIRRLLIQGKTITEIAETILQDTYQQGQYCLIIQR